jgi:hypothetical protein
MMTAAATGAHDPAAVPLPSNFADFELGADAIARRFDWARRQGHPRYLWPGISPQEWRSALRVIERAVVWLLGGDDHVRLDLPADVRPNALGIAAYTSGLGPWLGRACETGRLETSSPVGSVLAAHVAHNRLRAAHLDQQLQRTLRLLIEVDARPVLLKSAHTMCAYFEEPGLRPCTDLDIAVAPESFGRAAKQLCAAGYTPSTRQNWPRRCDFFPPGAPRTLRSLDLVHAENPYTIELHASIDRAFHGVRTIAIPAAGLTEAGSPFAGARVLAPHYLAIYLALHAAEELYHLQLLRIVELNAVVNSALKTSADWIGSSARFSPRCRRVRFPGVCSARSRLPRYHPGGPAGRVGQGMPGAGSSPPGQRVCERPAAAGNIISGATISLGEHAGPGCAPARVPLTRLVRPLARCPRWAFGLLRRRSS